RLDERRVQVEVSKRHPTLSLWDTVSGSSVVNPRTSSSIPAIGRMPLGAENGAIWNGRDGRHAGLLARRAGCLEIGDAHTDDRRRPRPSRGGATSRRADL